MRMLITVSYGTASGAVCHSHADGQLDGRIVRANLVDERGQPIRERGVLDLEHVLRVRLAGVREVEAAEEDGVVADGHLRVHVVVHRARRVRRRALAGERRGREHGPQRGRLPRLDRVRAPTAGAPR